MIPTRQLTPIGAMAGPAAAAVMAALMTDGAPARFVGGCVRDAVLGVSARDVDIATPLPPDTVMARLKAAGIKAIPTGIAHGTVTALCDGQPFEITTLRRDVETDGRHAVVAFTDDWSEDAARRDFTYNALSLAPDGALYDPFGGLTDLAAGRTRFIGDPADRIHEDVLRILRFFRFHARFGKGPPDSAGLAACRDAAPRLVHLSGERVRDELLRLLAGPKAAATWGVMVEAGILAPLLPQAIRTDRLSALEALADSLPEAAADGLLRLAATLPPDRTLAETVADRLRLSNAQRDRLVLLTAPPVDTATLGDPHARRHALQDLGGPAVRDLLLLAAADATAPAGLSGALADAAAWQPIPFPLSGQDVLALGLPPGPEVGRRLAAVQAWWREHDFLPDRQACLERLRATVSP